MKYVIHTKTKQKIPVTLSHYIKIFDNGKEMVLCHDDSCDHPLIGGSCPHCNIHLDMQSLCFRPVLDDAYEFTLKIVGFTSKAQVQEFVNWYTERGEQEISTWLECRKQEGIIDIDTLETNGQRTYPILFRNNEATMTVIPK